MSWDVVTFWLGVPATVLTLLGIGGLALPWVRRPVRRVVSTRRYARWFRAEYRRYRNKYIDPKHTLDLAATYIPLSFQAAGKAPENRLAALDVLIDRTTRRAVIVGDPGSGKSTLLSFLGITLLQPRRRARQKQPGRHGAPEVPILVSLRRFARCVDKLGLADYLIADVLASQAGLRRETAYTVLQRLLRQRRCVVLLDGLDEVHTDRYDTVRDAVHAFAGDHSEEMPTANARIIITCRRQYFDRKRNEWTDDSTVADAPGRVDDRFLLVHELAQLRTSEIITYLGKLQDWFAAHDGPGRFMEAVHRSGTLDIHRTPLILAMSVGYYAPRYQFDVPHTVGELYRLIITEMLQRRDFNAQIGGGVNRFLVEDKRRLLQEFALAAALGTRGFDQFERADLIEFAEDLALNLKNVPKGDAAEFVDEVIIHSGLLSDTTGRDGLEFVFAHQSIQEHLAAEDLLSPRHPREHALKTLADKALHDEWRQVIIFYSAAAHQNIASALLEELAARNLLLAGSCLAGADCTDDVADRILRRLAERASAARDRAPRLNGASLDIQAGSTANDDTQHDYDLVQALSVILAAVGSPRPAVVKIATRHARALLAPLTGVDPHQPADGGRLDPGMAEAMGGDIGGALRLLETVSQTRAVEIAALVPDIARALPDDRQLVAPLWRCLLAPDMNCYPNAAGEIVDRLLSLAMDRACFDDLQGQDEDPGTDFLTTELRRHAYPFKAGLNLTSNLVTLLAWADHLALNPHKHNRFLAARAAGKLQRVEDDKRRTVTLPVFLLGRTLSGTLMAITLVAAALVLATRPETIFDFQDPQTRPRWHAALVGIAVLGSSTLAVLPLVRPWHERLADASGSEPERGTDSGHLFFASVPLTPFLLRPVLWLPVFVAPFAAIVRGQLEVTSSLIILLYFGAHFVLTLRLFSRDGPTIHIYRPNRFVDMYDDPESRHWIVRGD